MGIGGSLTITNSTISDNHAGSEGGGIFQLGGTMSLQNVTVSGNSAYSGGRYLQAVERRGVAHPRDDRRELRHALRSHLLPR